MLLVRFAEVVLGIANSAMNLAPIGAHLLIGLLA